MSRLRVLAGVLAVVIFTGGWLAGQDKKDGDTPTKLKGQLPQNWKKIGLTEEQTQKVYKVQNDYKPQIDELQGKIKKLSAERDAEMLKVLTDDQKAALKKLIETKSGVGDKKGDDKKKTDDKKSDDKRTDDKKTDAKKTEDKKTEDKK